MFVDEIACRCGDVVFHQATSTSIAENTAILQPPDSGHGFPKSMRPQQNHPLKMFGIFHSKYHKFWRISSDFFVQG